MSTTANWGVPYVASTDAIGGYPSISSSLANKVDTLADHFDYFCARSITLGAAISLTSTQALKTGWSASFATSGYNMTNQLTATSYGITLPAYFSCVVIANLEASGLSDGQNFASNIYVYSTRTISDSYSYSAKIVEANANGYAEASHCFCFPAQTSARYIYVGARSTGGGGTLDTNSNIVVLAWKTGAI